jgi:hypothetical protein
MKQHTYGVSFVVQDYCNETAQLLRSFNCTVKLDRNQNKYAGDIVWRYEHVQITRGAQFGFSIRDFKLCP